MINKGNINEIYLTLCERLESTQLCSFIILVSLVFRYPVDIMQTIYHIWLLFLLHLVKRSLTLLSWFASSNVISLYPSFILYSLYDFFFDIFFFCKQIWFWCSFYWFGDDYEPHWRLINLFWRTFKNVYNNGRVAKFNPMLKPVTTYKLHSKCPTAL